MCGIAGWFGSKSLEPHVAGQIAQRLRHRGPDAEGIRSFPDATLIHRRLSIIDLTPTGEQPMANEDGTIWLVFNGEIYNHHPLRAGLEAGGHCFRGRADSEVLPHLYERDGREFLSALRGMFAFAIYNQTRRRLLLARDRFGIKPLFYAPLGDGIAFASEVRALQVVPGVDLEVDPQSLSDYTSLSYVPAPRTFFKGIHALEPGCWLEADLGGGAFRYTTGRYHRHAIRPRRELELERVVEQADALVAEAVRSQLESDVAIGALLSGGIDSSLMSAAAQAALAPARLRTFNVRFADAGYDETWAARMVAEHIGSEHETLPFETGAGSWEAIAGLLAHAGQPFADTSMFAVNAVSRLMRRRVKVALSGDGGDEAFGGYDLYWQIERFAGVRRLPAAAVRGGALALRLARRVDPKYGRWSERLSDLSGSNSTIIGSLFRWVREKELRALLPGLDVDPVQRLFEPQWDHELPPDASAVDRLDAHATEVNARLVLPNDFLFKVDIASMRESLEVRVPMLDENLFELGLALPHRLKVRGRTGKIVLRALAERKLPRAVATKPKWGFGVPLDTWVDEAFLERLRGTLTASSPISAWYDPAAYLPLVEAFSRRTGDVEGVSRQGLYQRIILLLAVHVILEEVAAARAASAGAPVAVPS